VITTRAWQENTDLFDLKRSVSVYYMQGAKLDAAGVKAVLGFTTVSDEGLEKKLPC